jgi:DNA-binding transcriptional ArsR family regulator
MSKSKADLILHPIRARIITEVSGRQLTAKVLAETMPEIPRTTLYRHINALTKGGILVVVEENQVRGTVERVYALNRESTDLSPEELSQMPVADGLKFGKVQLHLTDSEFEALHTEVYDAIEAVVGNEPSADRKPRIASVSFLPKSNT